MGLYDTISVDKTVLNRAVKTRKEKINWVAPIHLLQTKDLGRSLNNFKITKSGQLYKKQVESQWVENKDDKFGGSLEEISSKWIKDYHNGRVVFYGEFPDKDENYYWVDFVAEFKKGKICQIKLDKIELSSTKKQREESGAKIKQIFEDHKKSWQYRARKFFVYVYLIDCFQKFLHKIEQVVSRFRIWILKNF